MEPWAPGVLGNQGDWRQSFISPMPVGGILGEAPLSSSASPLNLPSCFTSRPVDTSAGEIKQGEMSHRRDNGANVIPC